MTIIPRAKIRFAVIRSLRLGATLPEAYATVAEIFHLPVETVETCYREVTHPEEFA